MSKKILIIPIIIAIAIVGVLIFKSQNTQEAESAKREGLVAYWSFDRGFLQTRNGIDNAMVLDRSGRENHLKMYTNSYGTGSVTSTEGKYNESIYFDYKHGFMRASSVTSTGLLINDKVTVSAWIKPITTSSYRGIVQVGKTALTEKSGYALFVRDTLDTVCFNVSNGVANAISGFSACYEQGWDATDGEWHHIVGQYDTSTNKLRIYVDTVKGTDDTFTGDIAYLSHVVQVGTNSVGGYIFGGDIDEIKIWNRILSKAEIDALYRSRHLLNSVSNVPSRISGTTTEDNIIKRLIAHWTMDTGDVVEGKVLDVSGNGNHLTAYGFYNGQPPTSTAGKRKQAIEFDGNNGCLVLDDPGTNLSDFDLTEELTIATWINITNGIADKGRILMKSGSYNWYLEDYGSANRSCTSRWFGLSDEWLDPTTIMPYGSWQHIAIVYASGTTANGLGKRWYRNGTARDSENTTGTIANTNNDVSIGCDADLTGPFMLGAIDEVKVWNYALTAAEISDEYNNRWNNTDKKTYARTLPRNGLLAYWNMDVNDSTSTAIFDKTGDGFNLKPYGFYANEYPTSTKGKMREAIDFDGTNGYACVADPNNRFDFSGNDEISISAWIYPETGISDGDDFGGEEQDWNIYVEDFGGANRYWAMREQGGLSDEFLYSSNPLKLDRWTHFVYTYASGTAAAGLGKRLYLNGELDNSENTTGGISGEFSRELCIGTLTDAGGGLWQGYVDEVMIWNRALSVEEIERVYEYSLTHRE
ncbi:LamG domain-containing protein [Patescibacteria group bacterium]